MSDDALTKSGKGYWMGVILDKDEQLVVIQ